MAKVVIIGGGPGGYEAALVASQLGGDVCLIEANGLGGAAVLTDCVPSKTLIATAEVLTQTRAADELGISIAGAEPGRSFADSITVDLGKVNQRVRDLAKAQSGDIRSKLEAEGVEILDGRGRLAGPHEIVVETASGSRTMAADIVLLAVGTTPRQLSSAPCDGERVLNWTQLYSLTELPKRLIVVGSGVTGAEFASAYNALGSDVVLVSSRSHVLPGADEDAALVLQRAFETSGMTVLSESRAESVTREGNEVRVTLSDGRVVSGSHCLMAVGAIPNTSGLGLQEAGIEVSERGHIVVDQVSRTSVRGVYAAGDCTGVFPLASVAAMQGRIAMWHSLGDSVSPLDLRTVSSNVFTAPEIATVGITQADVAEGRVRAAEVMLPLAAIARAKMRGLHEGFVKLFCLPTTGIIVGGVVVAPRASELIHAISVAVSERITVDRFAQDFTVYPSLSGSIAEAARRLHGHSELQSITL